MSTPPQDPYMTNSNFSHQPPLQPQPPMGPHQAPAGQHVPASQADMPGGLPATPGLEASYPPVRTIIEPMGRLTFWRALTSELLKLWTSPGVHWATGVSLAFYALFTALVYSSLTEFAQPVTTDGIVGSFFFPMVLTTSIAIAHMTNEYAHTSIRVSLQSVPNRLLFYSSKLISVALYSLLIPLVTLAISMGLAELVNSTYGIFDDLRPYLSYVIITMVTAIAACSLGSMFRNTAAAITVVFSAIFILQIFGAMMLSYTRGFEQYMPFNLIMRAIMPTESWFGSLDPAVALLVYVGYCVAVIIFGAVTIHRRDA